MHQKKKKKIEKKGLFFPSVLPCGYSGLLQKAQLHIITELFSDSAFTNLFIIIFF